MLLLIVTELNQFISNKYQPVVSSIQKSKYVCMSVQKKNLTILFLLFFFKVGPPKREDLKKSPKTSPCKRETSADKRNAAADGGSRSMVSCSEVNTPPDFPRHNICAIVSSGFHGSVYHYLAILTMNRYQMALLVV